MKYLMLVCTVLVSLQIKAQQLVRVKDTVNGFSVALPSDWMNGSDNIQGELKFMAWRPLQDTNSKRLPPNVMVFVQPFAEEEPSLTTVVELLESSSDNAVYSHLIDSGTINTFNQKIQWIDKKYVSDESPDTLFASNFITYADGKIFIMTIACYNDERAANTELFRLMGQSLFVGDAIKEEFLKVSLPTGIQWTTISDELMAEGRILQKIPAGETLDTWKSVYAGLASRFIKLETMDEVLQYYTENWKKNAPNLHIQSIDKGAKSDGQWALVQIDTTPGSDASMKETSLYYFFKTDHYLHLHSITSRGSQFTPGIAKTWSDVFKNGKIVHE